MRRSVLALLALMLVLVLSGCGRQNAETPPENAAQGGTNMEHIWKLTDTNDFVIALTEHMGAKTHYGEDLSMLREAERVFYITQTLEMEVNNGGFSQFFYNAGGDLSGELVSAFRAIGADRTAAICQQAIDAFGCAIPVDREERIALLDTLEDAGLDDRLEECDNAFFAYEDDLNELNYRYVLANREQFD